MSDDMRWHGDPFPAGLGPDDRIAWPVAATVVVRYVPDPETGKKTGLAMEYSGDLPKLILAHQLMAMIQDLMTHDDFQEGIPLQETGPDGSLKEDDA